MSYLDLLTPEEYSVDLKIAEKTIKIRPYTHGDTKPFLEMLEDYKTNKIKKVKRIFEAQQNLIDKCIISDSAGNQVRSADLHRADFIQLMMKLKDITRGEDQPISFRCSNSSCSDKNKEQHIETLQFSFDEAVLESSETEDFVNIETPRGTIKVNLYPYTFGKMIENSAMFEDDLPNHEVISKFQASFIESIEVGEEISDKLPMQAKIDFINRLVPKYQLQISKWIDAQPMWKWEKKWKCPVCEAENIAVLKGVQDFFV